MNIKLSLKEPYNIALFFIITLLTVKVQAQDTIPINLHKSTQLIFNKEINDMIVGTGDLQVQMTKLNNVISFISKAEKKDFVNTNLYVNTKDGYHYNFNIIFKETAKKWTIPINEELATVKPIKKKKTENETSINSTTILKSLLADKRRAKKYYNRFDDVYFRYVNHYYYNQFVYYKLEITNSSNQDFIISFLKIFVDTKGKRGDTKKSDTRKLLLLDKDYSNIYGSNFIKPEATVTIILKFKKLSLNKEQKLTLELKEKNGNRDLTLNLNSRLVNDPYDIKL
jgi:hypothetical protein